MRQKCVISLGVNRAVAGTGDVPSRQDFPRGIARIRNDLSAFGFQGDYLSWDKHFPEGTPSGEEIPYAFKPFCFFEALDKEYRLVLWLDASIKIKKPKKGRLFSFGVR